MKGEIVWSTRALLLQFFKERGRPNVIFHRDLIIFAAGRQKGNWVTRALNTKNFNAQMEAHGYVAVRNPNAPEWRLGEFRTRTAYVLDDGEVENRAAVVLAALEERS